MKQTVTREAQMLRSARQKAGLTQLQLATELEVQPKQYQRLEYGERPFSSVNIRLGLKICRILQINPFDLVLGETGGMNPKPQMQNKPPGERRPDSWNGREAYPDPTANQALYNVTIEWNRKKRLAIRLRLMGKEPDPREYTGIFVRLLNAPLEELMGDKYG